MYCSLIAPVAVVDPAYSHPFQTAMTTNASQKFDGPKSSNGPATKYSTSPMPIAASTNSNGSAAAAPARRDRAGVVTTPTGPSP